MMKCYFGFMLFLGMVAQLSATAQCTPDTDIQGLYEPSTAEGLPGATIDMYYETTISLNVPSDTSYLSFSATVDSMVLLDMEGLPEGISYSCNPASCSFPGGELGCILLSGTPTDTTDIGDNQLTAKFNFHIHSSVVPPTVLSYDIEGYILQVDGPAISAVSQPASRSNEHAFFVEPNPVRLNSKLVFDLPADGAYTLSMYSLLGSEVANMQQVGNQGRLSYPVTEFGLQPGVYFVVLKQGSYSKSLRFVVQ